MTEMNTSSSTLQQDDLLRMSQIIRHRLRNVASGIRGAITLIQEETEGVIANDLREYFPLIVRECESLQDIATRLSMLFDPVPPHDARDLLEVTNPVLEELAMQYPHVEFRKTYPVPPARVPTNMAIAIREILRNACEAAPKGIVATQVSIQDGMVIWAMHDSGPGIPEADRQQAFLPFFTTRPRHLGLGLPVARRIAEHHGGSCEIRAESGGEAKTYIMLSSPLLPIATNPL
jgi:two-component system, NtrC family, sensor histidine kinase HydH